MPPKKGKERADEEERGKHKRCRTAQMDSAQFGLPSPDISNIAFEAQRPFPMPQPADQPAETTSHIALATLDDYGSHGPAGDPYEELGSHLDVHTQWTEYAHRQHPAYERPEDPDDARQATLPVSAVDLEDGIGDDLVFRACRFLAMHDSKGAHYAWMCLMCHPSYVTPYSTWLEAKVHHDHVHLPDVLAADQMAVSRTEHIPIMVGEGFQAASTDNPAKSVFPVPREESLNQNIVHVSTYEHLGEDSPDAGAERTVNAIISDRSSYPWHDEGVQLKIVLCKVDSCTESFSKVSALRKHQKSHLPRAQPTLKGNALKLWLAGLPVETIFEPELTTEFVCDFPRHNGRACGERRCSRGDLNKHLRDHIPKNHPDLPHECAGCKTRFVYPRDKVRCELKHADRKEAYCPRCGVGQARAHNMPRHLKTCRVMGTVAESYTAADGIVDPGAGPSTPAPQGQSRPGQSQRDAAGESLPSTGQPGGPSAPAAYGQAHPRGPISQAGQQLGRDATNATSTFAGYPQVPHEMITGNPVSSLSGSGSAVFPHVPWRSTGVGQLSSRHGQRNAVTPLRHLHVPRLGMPGPRTSYVEATSPGDPGPCTMSRTTSSSRFYHVSKPSVSGWTGESCARKSFGQSTAPTSMSRFAGTDRRTYSQVVQQGLERDLPKSTKAKTKENPLSTQTERAQSTRSASEANFVLVVRPKKSKTGQTDRHQPRGKR